MAAVLRIGSVKWPLLAFPPTNDWWLRDEDNQSNPKTIPNDADAQECYESFVAQQAGANHERCVFGGIGNC